MSSNAPNQLSDIQLTTVLATTERRNSGDECGLEIECYAVEADFGKVKICVHRNTESRWMVEEEG
jgi:hypothetical protein